MDCIRKITPKLLSLGGHFSAFLSHIDAFLCQYFLEMLDMLDTNLAPVATDPKYLWGRCKLTNPTSFLTVKVPIGSTLYDKILLMPFWNAHTFHTSLEKIDVLGSPFVEQSSNFFVWVLTSFSKMI